MANVKLWTQRTELSYPLGLVQKGLAEIGSGSALEAPPGARDQIFTIMNSTSPTGPLPVPEGICEMCGRPDAIRMGDRWLCPDCISVAGSCCPEFGAWDAWASEPPKATHDRARRRFEIPLGNDTAPAFLSYAVEGDIVTFQHTFVPEKLRGRGLAAVLVRVALTEARRARWKIIPACSYVAAFIRRHPEHADLIVRGQIS